MPDPDEGSSGQRHGRDPDCPGDRRQYDGVLDRSRHHLQARSRRSCDRPHHAQLGGGKRRHRDARRAPRVRAFPAAEHNAADRGGGLSASDADARQRQLRGTHRHRVAELFRYARHSPRSRQKLHRGRSGARHVGPRRRHRSSCVAELLWRDPRHRRAEGGGQRPARDGRRRRRSGVSRRLAGGDGRPLGTAGR